MIGSVSRFMESVHFSANTMPLGFNYQVGRAKKKASRKRPFLRELAEEVSVEQQLSMRVSGVFFL